MAKAKVKRIIWMLLIAALLVAGAFRAWEWLQPHRAFGAVEGLRIYVQH
jgi:hypothetical protein